MSRGGAVAAGVAVALGVAASVGLAGWATSRRLRHTRVPTGAGVLHVAVTAREWRWDVAHPGPDGVLGTRDDELRVGELRVPAGRDVVVHLRGAGAFVHELYLPAYGARAMAAPGREAVFWFRAGAPGESAMVCSNFCGVGHADMRGRVVVAGR